MMRKDAYRDWQNWAVIGIRFLLAAAVALIIMMNPNTMTEQDTTKTLLISIGVVFGVTLLLAGLLFIKSAREYVRYAILFTDLITVGALVWVIEGDALLLPVATGVVIIGGLLRLGWTLGTVQAVGVLVVATAIQFVQQPFILDRLTDYYPSMVVLAAFTSSVALWVYLRDREYHIADNRVKEVREEYERKVGELRDSQHAIAELSTRISATLVYDKVIDAALDIGRVFIRDQSRMVSVVLLFRAGTDMLYVASARGLNRLDENREIPGKRGVVGQSLIDCQPVIQAGTKQDPELADWVSFVGIQSVLSIPMRIGFDNYGVLLFGSELPDAFSSDRIDTLMALSTQVTMALQNAVLYANQIEDKERIIAIEEDARKSLVRDLHDIPTQTISSITMRTHIALRLLNEAKYSQAKEELENVQQMAQRATEEIRHVLFKLRPLALEAQGLTAALTQLAEKTIKTYKQNVVLRLAPDIETYLDKQKQGTLFYLIEEAVNNARKYAQAETITVRIGRKNNMLITRIEDNGVGFETQAVNNNYTDRGSFGMVNMRERAELLGGSLAVESAPNQGTVITVLIPIGEAVDTSVSTRSKVSALMPKSKLALNAQKSVDKQVRR